MVAAMLGRAQAPPKLPGDYGALTFPGQGSSAAGLLSANLVC